LSGVGAVSSVQWKQTRILEETSLLDSGRSTASDELRNPRVNPLAPCLPEFSMRSDKIHRALAQGMNRFEVCQLVAKGVKATHKTGARFEDSINDVLQYLGTHETLKESLHPAAPQVSVKSLKPAA
jgi:uncharacterized protein YoaH (UPF0181 family)